MKKTFQKHAPPFIFRIMKKEAIRSGNAPEPIGPYSQAIKAGGFLFASGQIAIDPATNQLLDGSLEDETNLVMKNIKAVLDEAGLDFSSIIKCSIFLSSMDDFARVNEVYGSYFEAPYPARETVEVSKLPKGVRVEISFVAITK